MPPYINLLSAIARGGDPGIPPPDLRSKSLILVKIWCMIIIFGVTMVAGMSPCLMKWSEGFVLLGTQFAGGVFLGTALMEFLSDSNETFGYLTSKDYPFAFLLASFGYLLTLLADCIILYVYQKRKPAADQLRFQGGVQPSSITGTSQSQTQVVGDTVNDCMDLSFWTTSYLGDSTLLITALCFHSVFEGIVIGIAGTKSMAWRALWIVSLHKVFAAIAMGIALLQTIPNRPLLSCAAYAFALAISSSFGVVIGIVLDATAWGTVADWIYAISMGILSGVFVFISVHHLIFRIYCPARRISVDAPHYKFLAVLLGIAAIAIVIIWAT